MPQVIQFAEGREDFVQKKLQVLLIAKHSFIKSLSNTSALCSFYFMVKLVMSMFYMRLWSYSKNCKTFKKISEIPKLKKESLYLGLQLISASTI